MTQTRWTEEKISKKFTVRPTTASSSGRSAPASLIKSKMKGKGPDITISVH